MHLGVPWINLHFNSIHITVLSSYQVLPCLLGSMGILHQWNAISKVCGSGSGMLLDTDNDCTAICSALLYDRRTMCIQMRCFYIWCVFFTWRITSSMYILSKIWWKKLWRYWEDWNTFGIFDSLLPHIAILLARIISWS